MIQRKQTRQLYIGDIPVGGGAPIVIQSMNNTKTADVKSTLEQLRQLKAAGCQVGRLAVPDEEAAEALKEIIPLSPVPLVADIHFNYRLALKAMDYGIHALRINPGNIGGEDRVRAVAEMAKEKNIPVRIGINGGSLPKDILEKYGVTPEAMVEGALREVSLFEKFNYNQIKISVKSSSVLKTVEAYNILSQKVDYPLHIGITEAGTPLKGSIKSAMGIGILLYQGIGDTIRVSLTGDPVKEVLCAKEILKNLGLREEGVEVISCPTCGRTKVDLEAMVNDTELQLASYRFARPLKVAVMGCEVNGPGEAKEADYGIANGNGAGLLFRKGEIIGKYPEKQIVRALIDEIRRNEKYEIQ